ncbi:hypothetical protein [Streptomyces sp. NPDC020965]|uniref:hypothetical protein n=1 Tax=Streptomyces sp. NPDC020965 TaxID=3365105 RepID=UPI003795DF57
MSGGTIAIVITLIVVGGISASTVAYFGLQRHRADAAAMSHYRGLAEAVVEEQKVLLRELKELRGHVLAVEDLLRSVDER